MFLKNDQHFNNWVSGMRFRIEVSKETRFGITQACPDFSKSGQEIFFHSVWNAEELREILTALKDCYTMVEDRVDADPQEAESQRKLEISPGLSILQSLEDLGLF